jgi:outer membrane protein assembly factor BamA
MPEPTDNPTPTIKELEIDGYKFTVDTDLLDNVDAFEHIDRIENQQQIAAIVPLLKFLIGDQGYDDMKAHYVKTEGKFRLTKLSKVYELIIENFDPKDSPS